jgi:hypothetical protein
MLSTVIDQTYLEKPTDANSCTFSHITLREGASGHAVEEVTGTVDPEGKRRGEIASLISGVALDVAREAFEQRLSERAAAGYYPARPNR